MANSKKPEGNKSSKADDSPSWLGENLLWGGLLVLIGGLLLLSNFGLASLQWANLWQLWPVLILIAGLSFLSLRGWVAITVYGVSALLVAGLTIATLTGVFGDEAASTQDRKFTIDRSSSGIDSLAVDIEAGAASIDINSIDSESLIEGQLRSSQTILDTQSETKGSKQMVALELRRKHWLSLGAFGGLDTQINRSLPLDLTIDAGASSIDADLSDLMLQSLLIDSGASSIDLKLGDRLGSSDITIDTGASSVTIKVPSSAGVKLVLDTGLSSKNLPNDYMQIDDKTYHSKNYDSSSNKINIFIDMGASSFMLSTY